MKKVIWSPTARRSLRRTSDFILVIHQSVSMFYLNFTEHVRILMIWDNRQNAAELYRKLTDANRPKNP